VLVRTDKPGTYEAIELLKRARASIYKHKTLTIALATIEADRRMVGASSIRTRSGEFGVDGPPAIGAGRWRRSH
jgi:hypothetical protein